MENRQTQHRTLYNQNNTNKVTKLNEQHRLREHGTGAQVHDDDHKTSVVMTAT